MLEKRLLLVTLFATTFILSAADYVEYRHVHGSEENDKMKVVFRNKRQANITNQTTFEDHHIYYTSRYLPPGPEADSLWFELTDLLGSGDNVLTNVSEASIQDLFRYYQFWRLKFRFPFYGHLLDILAVTTGGFLYTSTFIHNQIHLTQYIAPLQANFNPSLNDSSRILVYSTEKQFTVQWDEVHNHDHVNDGPFSFQVSLFPNGTIYFAYQEIPLPVNRISNDNHPVEVGLADSFYIDSFQPPFVVRSIYEYSRIRLNATQDLAMSAYIITPIRNCISATSCETCAAISAEGNFDCSWCSTLNRCSDSIDRHRQQWFFSNCIRNAVKVCPTTPTPSVLSISSSVQTFASSQIFITSSQNFISSSHEISSSLSTTTLESSPLTVVASIRLTASSQIFTMHSQIFITSFLSTSSLLATSTTTSLSSSSRIFITSSLFSTSSISSLLAPSTTSSLSSSSSQIFITPSSTTSSPFIIVVSPTAATSSGLSAAAEASIAAVVIIIVAVALTVGTVAILLLIYGYKNPHSKLGMFMIESRSKAFKGAVKYNSEGEKAILEDDDDEIDKAGTAL